MNTEATDILMNLIYPNGPAQCLETKTGPGNSIIHLDTRALKVLSVEGKDEKTFRKTLGSPATMSEDEINALYNADAALIQIVKHEKQSIGILVWSLSPGPNIELAEQFDLSLGQNKIPGSHTANLLDYKYLESETHSSTDVLSIATEMLPHQWLNLLGTELTSAEVYIHGNNLPCYSESGWLGIRWEDDDGDHAYLAYKFKMDSRSEPEPTGPDCMPTNAPEDNVPTGLPVPDHLLPSLLGTLGGFHFFEPYPKSYPYEAILVSAFLSAISGGETLKDLELFIQQLTPDQSRALTIPESADPEHLEQDIVDVCEDPYIPTFLALIEGWLSNHKRELPPSLLPGTPDLQKTLLHFAGILHEAGAPYE